MCGPSSPKTAVTTTAFADFCRVTRPIAVPCARLSRYCPPPHSLAQGWWPPWRLDLDQPADPSGSLQNRAPRPSRQISPNKNISFPCTTAAFTLPAVTIGLHHPVLTRPRARPSMRFLFVGSHVCTRASFGHRLAVMPLPSASGYPCHLQHVGYSHRGLAPHKLVPMSGVHCRMQRTRHGVLRPPRRAADA